MANDNILNPEIINNPDNLNSKLTNPEIINNPDLIDPEDDQENINNPDAGI